MQQGFHQQFTPLVIVPFMMCWMLLKLSDEKKQAERDQTFEIIRSSLGFISIEQARESLFPIANDELIRRLRVYQRGSVHE